MIRSKTFCILPWIHLSTRPNGHLRLCCTANASGVGSLHKNIDSEIGILRGSDGIPSNLGHHSITEAWNNDFMKSIRLQFLRGEIPASCSKCFIEENSGHRSKRQWETAYWGNEIDIDKIIGDTKEDGSVLPIIPYLDIRMGNKCDIKCIMCSPHDSSLWENDWYKVHTKFKNENVKKCFTWDNQGATDGASYEWFKNPIFWKELYEQIPHIKQLYFAGGEALIIKEYNSLLKEIIKMGKAPDIYVRYNSNGLTLSDELLDLWKNFKFVRFLFSVDSIYEMNRYIRYPSSWKLVMKKLKKIDTESGDNVQVLIACAVQMLNMYYIPEIIKWKLSQNFEKINPWPLGGGMVNFHLVYYPPFLNIRVFPKWFKKKITEKFEDFYTWLHENYRSDKDFINSEWGEKRLKGLVSFMNSEDWSNKMPEFRDFINTVDDVRGTDFRTTFPEMKDLMEEDI